MARSIQQIKQELASLEEIVSSIGDELQDLYRNYIDLLNQSAKKQLILTVYQICTQIYPKPFLNLTLSEREKLQENIRQLGKQIQQMLQDDLEGKTEPVVPPNLDIIEQMIVELNPDEENSLENSLDIERELPEISFEEILEVEKEQIEKTEEELTNAAEYQGNYLKSKKDPDSLIKWQKGLEAAIKRTLEIVSKEANNYLQQAGIISKQLPTKVLDVAVEAQEAVGAIGKFPHVLDLAIETENKQEQKKAKLSKISVLSLRLSEIEYTDPTLSAERNKIRNVLENLSRIRQKYQKKKRECAVAEAEAAWRASWFD